MVLVPSPEIVQSAALLRGRRWQILVAAHEASPRATVGARTRPSSTHRAPPSNRPALEDAKSRLSRVRASGRERVKVCPASWLHDETVRPQRSLEDSRLASGRFAGVCGDGPRSAVRVGAVLAWQAPASCPVRSSPVHLCSPDERQSSHRLYFRFCMAGRSKRSISFAQDCARRSNRPPSAKVRRSPPGSPSPPNAGVVERDEMASPSRNAHSAIHRGRVRGRHDPVSSGPLRHSRTITGVSVDRGPCYASRLGSTATQRCHSRLSSPAAGGPGTGPAAAAASNDAVRAGLDIAPPRGMALVPAVHRDP